MDLGRLRDLVEGQDGRIVLWTDEGSIVSVPRHAWRSFRNVGDQDAHMIVVNGGDTRVRLEWPQETVAAAEEAGFVVDAGGYLAESHLVLGQYPVVV